MAEKGSALTVDVTIEAPAAEVWASVRDPHQLRRWYGRLDEEFQRLDGATVDEDTHTLIVSGGGRLELQSKGDRTRVLVTLAESSEAPRVDEAAEDWMCSLQQLRLVHELKPEHSRRTLHFAGRGEPEALGTLLKSVPADVGATWFRTGHTQGIVLPDLGPGLLITFAGPSVTGDDGTPRVDVRVTVTMFGIVDGEFGFQRDIWTAWWRSVFPQSAIAP